jgi:hypothetical protein
MAKLNVSATVTSAPTDISLEVNSTEISMSRDSTGKWAGKAQLDLPDSVGVDFQAEGIPSSPWTLEIKFVTLPPEGKVLKDFKHDDSIPEDGKSEFTDTVNLTAKAGAGAQ